MSKRKKKKWFCKLDMALLGIASLLLCSTLIQILDLEMVNVFQSRVATFLTGDFSAQEIVQAIGMWGENDESVATVFHPSSYNENNDYKAKASVSSNFEQDILQKQVLLFPDTIDSMTYIINLPCKTPTVGTVSSGFGQRTDPIEGEIGYHYGIDIAANEGTPILAVASGTIREVGENSYGKYVVIDHGDGLQSLYAHCSTVDVAEGDNIESGTQIAAVGMTGRATGNHLHFELWRAGYILDPTPYLEV